MARSEREIRSEISSLVAELYSVKFAPPAFIPAQTPVRYAGRVFGAEELQSGVSAMLDFWLTSGRYSEEFEAAFSAFTQLEYSILVNSGSSANLVAFTALTSELLGDRRLKAGDEVIVAAAAFPTTVNPVLQNGLIPVFVDVEIGTYNVDVAEIERALSPRTRAIFLAHTLGNPYNLDGVLRIVEKNDLWLVEDCCDALGSTYRGKHVGGFGHIATCSFYPAHHITMGEGGCVFTNDESLARAARSLRDWGRDCYCAGGESNSCGKRFSGQFGKLPKGYDHKYVYSHIGYNLKATDIQAAIGVEQLKRLPGFIQARKQNARTWFSELQEWEDRLVLPRATEGSDPAWFGFPVTLREGVPFSRTELTNYLSEHLVETRNLFAGNLLKQPAYLAIDHRVAPGGLERTDRIMRDTFFLGTYPGLTSRHIDYALETIRDFMKKTESKG